MIEKKPDLNLRSNRKDNEEEKTKGKVAHHSLEKALSEQSIVQMVAYEIEINLKQGVLLKNRFKSEH